MNAGAVGRPGVPACSSGWPTPAARPSISELAAAHRPAAADHPPAGALAARRAATSASSRRGATRSGPRLIRLGASAGRLLGDWADAAPAPVVDQVGESANLAVLDGDAVDVRRAGALAALDADVHRGRPAGAAALHRRRQGPAVGAAGRAGPGDPAPAPGCRPRPSTPSPRPTRWWPSWPSIRAPRVRRRRRRAGAGRALRRGRRARPAAGQRGALGVRAVEPGDRDRVGQIAPLLIAATGVWSPTWPAPTAPLRCGLAGATQQQRADRLAASAAAPVDRAGRDGRGGAAPSSRPTRQQAACAACSDSALNQRTPSSLRPSGVRSPNSRSRAMPPSG